MLVENVFLTQRKIWDLSTEDPKWDYKFVVYYISVQVSKLIFSESDFYPKSYISQYTV